MRIVIQWPDMLYFIVLLLSVIVFFMKLQSPHMKGQRGERYVASRLKLLDRNHYWVLNDLLLPSNGKTATTQIDHVVISTFGIFCIETKSYSHWIFGSADRPYWTQVIYRDKRRFYNPLWQNYSHIKAIEQVIGRQHLKEPIVSLVAFPAATRFRLYGTYGVGKVQLILSRIRLAMDPLYTPEQCKTMVARLRSANIQDMKARRQHIRDVRALQT